MTKVPLAEKKSSILTIFQCQETANVDRQASNAFVTEKGIEEMNWDKTNEPSLRIHCRTFSFCWWLRDETWEDEELRGIGIPECPDDEECIRIDEYDAANCEEPTTYGKGRRGRDCAVAWDVDGALDEAAVPKKEEPNCMRF